MRSMLLGTTAMFAANTDNGSSESKSASVFRNTKGEVIDGRKTHDIYEAYCVGADSWYQFVYSGEDCPVTNEKQAVAIIKAVKGAGDEIDLARVEALHNASPEVLEGDNKSDTTDKPKDISAAEPFYSNAIDMAKLIGSGVQNIVGRIVGKGDEMGATELLKIAALILLCEWRAELNESKRFEVCSKIVDMPDPGTTYKATEKGTRKQSNNPDYFRMTKADGTKGEASRFQIMWDNTEDGKRIVEMVEDFADKRENAKKEWIKRLHPTTYKQKKNMWLQRYRNAPKYLRQAARIEKQIFDVNKETNGMVIVELSRELDKDGNLTDTIVNTTEPIIVKDKNKPSDARSVSITTFLSWKPKQATGNTVAHLEETASRDRNQNNKKKELTLADVDVAFATKVLPLIGEKFTDDTFVSAMTPLVAKDDTLCLRMADTYAALYQWFGKDGKFVVRESELREAIAAVERKEREEKIKAKAEQQKAKEQTPAAA